MSIPRPDELDFTDAPALFDQLQLLYSAGACRPCIDLLCVVHGLDHLIVVDDIVANETCQTVAGWCREMQEKCGERGVLAGIWSHIAASDQSDNPGLWLHVHMWIGTNPNNVLTRDIPFITNPKETR